MPLIAVNGQPLINPNHWKDITAEQMAYIQATYEIFTGILEESDLFPDGLPELTFRVKNQIKVKG